ncbi:MAG TPA: NIL domain-containing protein [Chthonomonadaceae bacterium]|nr:NIL domain-containing protein [Chthonomonadaceae bacterium]
MPVVSAELNARKDAAGQPIVWRLAKLYNVVTTIRRARVTEDYACILLDIEGSREETDQALGYLRALGVMDGEAPTPASSGLPAPPESALPQPNTIYVRLSTVNAAQAEAPILFRVGRDFRVAVNIERAAFEEDGGSIEVTISGPLMEVQRAIAYLHTTGLHVNPRQRSVTDFSNL